MQPTDGDGPIIGIDLGSTNSCVSYTDEHGVCRPIPVGQGKTYIPSTVTIKNGKWLVGRAASQLPKSRFAFMAKRMIGRLSTDPMLRKDIKSLPFELYTTGASQAGNIIRSGVALKEIVVKVQKLKHAASISDYLISLLHADADHHAKECIEDLAFRLQDESLDGVEDLLYDFLVTEPLFDAGDELLQAEELSALVLLELKRIAEDHLGKRITKCVIAIPAYFTYAQRDCTRAAAAIAGLQVVRLVNEPSAAAIGYGKTTKLVSGLYVIFDLGGGTFDVSVLQFEDRSPQTYVAKATGGDNCLGGEDFTQGIASLTYDKTGLDKTNPKIAKEVRDEAERIKKDLAQYEEVEGEVSGQEFTVSREEEASVNAHLHERVQKVLKDTLMREVARRQKYQPETTFEQVARGLKGIIPVGGAFYTRGVKEDIRAVMGRDPFPPLDLSELVSVGAGYSPAGVVRLTEVLSRSLGIEVDDGTMSVILSQNTGLPDADTLEYYIPGGPCSGIEIRLVEGENKMARDNIHMGEFLLAIPPGTKDDDKIKVEIACDSDGNVNVIGKLLGAGTTEQLQVSRKPKHSEAQIAVMRENALERFHTQSSKRRLSGNGSQPSKRLVEGNGS